MSQPFTGEPIIIPPEILKQVDIRPDAWIGFMPEGNGIIIRIANPPHYRSPEHQPPA
jgi:hypothetical protein